MVYLFSSIPNIDGQKVTVSREINIRNNFAYDVLPNIEDHFILYHDKGVEQQFEIYDTDLRHIQTIVPELEKKHFVPAGVIAMDSVFHFYYLFRNDDTTILKVNAYNKNVYLKDTVILSEKKQKFNRETPKFTFSKDKSKVLIFSPEEKNLHLQLVDNNNLELISEFTLALKEINLKTDFEKIKVSNSGEIYILCRKSSFWSRNEDKGFYVIRIINQENIYTHRFSPAFGQVADLQMDLDEKNERLALAGLITDGDITKANGYFALSVNVNNIPENAEILINKFSSEFLAEVTGKKPGKAKDISDYSVKDILVRNDGGVVLICELVKEIARRGQINSPGQTGNYFPLRSFTDYYHEDIILIAAYANGKEHWKKILFKKQFSQDDNGIYSSYFLFKSPSRLKLIYNDEIKNSNTVSEYVLDPIGGVERRSVLSTEYQNLKLRFRDAIQIGPTSLIVPSEKAWKINLVKIDY
jgi:hypothetical protein